MLITSEKQTMPSQKTLLSVSIQSVFTIIQDETKMVVEVKPDLSSLMSTDYIHSKIDTYCNTFTPGEEMRFEISWQNVDTCFYVCWQLLLVQWNIVA